MSSLEGALPAPRYMAVGVPRVHIVVDNGSRKSFWLMAI